MSYANPPLVGPVTPPERIESIDVLRGFAVLGILVMNIQSFAMIDAAYINPTSYGDLTGINYLVWLLSHILADQKFMTIFSMLFGAGIVLMSERREHSGLKSAGVHYRRMVVLLVFGLLHSYLLWFGDILYTYALCGMIVYPFRRLRPRTLTLIGLCVLTIPTLLAVFAHFSLPSWSPEQLEATQQFWKPDAAAVAEDLVTYRGSWLQQMPSRARSSLWFQTELFAAEFIWRAGGLMLIGMACFKRGVFSAALSRATYVTFISVALLVGIPIIGLGARENFGHHWDFRWSLFLGSLYNYWASILVSFGWIGAIMLLCKSPRFTWLTGPLARNGRMAFTNYLMQTVIATTLFYGHGFGLFGYVERWGQALIVLAVCTFQLITSTFWMSRFEIGPMEWLWRRLTYGRPRPIARMIPSSSDPSP